MLNIYVALVDVVVWTGTNEIEYTRNASVLLRNFEKYRNDVLLKSQPNDNAQLLSKYDFNSFG